MRDSNVLITHTARKELVEWKEEIITHKEAHRPDVACKYLPRVHIQEILIVGR